MNGNDPSLVFIVFEGNHDWNEISRDINDKGIENVSQSIGSYKWNLSVLCSAGIVNGTIDSNGANITITAEVQ